MFSKTLFSLLVVVPGVGSAASIMVDFHNGSVTVSGLATRPAGTVVDVGTDTWNNIQNNGGVGLTFSNIGLNLSDGTASGATISANAGYAYFNNNGWGSGTQDSVMMEGWYGFRGSETITLSNLPSAFTSGGYTVTVYGDCDTVSRVMNYTLNDGVVSSTLTITDSGTFAGTFSAGVNHVTFAGLSGSGFTLNGNSGGSDPRSAINGIIITAVPEAASAALGALGSLLILRRRR